MPIIHFEKRLGEWTYDPGKLLGSVNHKKLSRHQRHGENMFNKCNRKM